MGHDFGFDDAHHLLIECRLPVRCVSWGVCRWVVTPTNIPCKHSSPPIIRQTKQILPRHIVVRREPTCIESADAAKTAWSRKWLSWPVVHISTCSLPPRLTKVCNAQLQAGRLHVVAMGVDVDLHGSEQTLQERRLDPVARWRPNIHVREVRRTASRWCGTRVEVEVAVGRSRTGEVLERPKLVRSRLTWRCSRG